MNILYHHDDISFNWTPTILVLKPVFVIMITPIGKNSFPEADYWEK